MKLYKHMRIEWVKYADVDHKCRTTLGFVVCDRDYKIQKIYNHGLFHEQSLSWWETVGNMALIYPIRQKEADRHVKVFLIESVVRAATGLPGVKAGRLFLHNLEKIDSKLADAARAAISVSRMLNSGVEQSFVDTALQNGDWTVRIP